MKHYAKDRRSAAIALTLGLAASMAGCGSKEPAAPAAAPAAPTTQTEVVPATATPVAATTPAPGPASWTPEAMEELLAPIALYPDPVLSQVLIASTNPQEVLDAGNWLLQNQSLTGNALDEAAKKVGFTPPIRALLQFPETVDMMCMQLDWTTELGQAFTADQQGVLDAVQRLRKQAKDVGNLQSSAQMKVETTEQDGKEVVLVSPPSPEVIYVPQYDPVAAYAPAPAAPAAAPATTTTTTATTGHSTGALITTGLLAFGAGMLVNEIFNDDDDWDDYQHGYYYPNYGHGGMPYYPPYPYRPAYGGGYYPANGYNRPPNYQHGFNNNTVIINNGGNNYWNNRTNTANRYQKPGAYQAKSPITAAKPNRPELQQLNKRQPQAMPKDVKRPSSTATADNWRSQSGYAGKGGKDKGSAARPTTGAAAAGKGTRELPKVQGGYAGATPERVKAQQANRPTSAGTQPSNRPTTRDMQQKPAAPRPAPGGGDRGYDKASRPQTTTKQQPMNRPAPTANRGGQGGGNAVSGANRGSTDRAASQRGKQSMPQGAKSKGGGGGGGGKGGKQKQGR
jgi:hypothetical protein